MQNIYSGTNKPGISNLPPRVFRGTKIERVGGERLWRYINRDSLIFNRWKILKPGASYRERAQAEEVVDRLLRSYNKRGIWHGAIVYGVFTARIAGNEMLMLHPGTEEELGRLKFAPSFAAKLSRKFRKDTFYVALQVVSLGEKVIAEGKRLGREGKDHDRFLLEGLAAELALALADFCQDSIPQYPYWDNVVRISPGHPDWPSKAEMRKAFDLLKAERIGVSLTSSYGIDPQYSSCAIIVPS